MKHTVAKIISLLFGLLWIPILIIFGVWKADLSQYLSFQIGLVFILFVVFIPLFLFYILFKKKKISEMDIINRKERIIPFIITIFCFLIVLIFSSFIHNSFLFQYQMILFIALIVNFCFTLFWKISLHMGMNTIGIIFINVFTGYQFWYLIFILPFVYWARLHLKRHTHAQLIAGVGINLFVSILLLYVFGYL